MKSADTRPLRAVDGRTALPEGATERPRADPDPSRESLLVEQWSRHYSDLVRYATHLLSGDVHAAEDVVQETAIRLWQHAEVVNDDQPLGGWLRRVAHNIVVDRARRRRARPTEVVLSPSVDGESADEFDDVDAEAAVATMLSGLSPRHRAVVYQVYAHDRPVVDVAADLGIPPGTVKSRCHTALRQLRGEAVASCA